MYAGDGITMVGISHDAKVSLITLYICHSR